MFTDGTVDVGGGRVRNELDIKTGKLANGVTWKLLAWFPSSEAPERHTELGVGHGQRDLLFIFDLVEKSGKTRGDFSFHERGDFLQSCSGTVEFLEALQLQPVDDELD